MKAAMYTEFQKPLTIQNVPDPTPSNHGVVIRVEAAQATCRELGGRAQLTVVGECDRKRAW